MPYLPVSSVVHRSRGRRQTRITMGVRYRDLAEGPNRVKRFK
jgi:hypothetical protein